MSKILIDGYEVPVECMSPDMSRMPKYVTLPPGMAEWMHINGLCAVPIQERFKLWEEHKNT